MQTDFYLHNEAAAGTAAARPQSYSQWWDAPVFSSLPWAADELLKGARGKLTLLKTVRSDDRVNQFTEHYQPYRRTELAELFSAQMSNSLKDFKPKFAVDPSPFALRVQPGRREEEYGTKGKEVNPNISGKDSTTSLFSSGGGGAGSDGGSSSSSASSDIDGMDSDDSGESVTSRGGGEAASNYVSFQELFPTMKQVYGTDLQEPELHNIAKYKRFVQIGENASRRRAVESLAAAPSKHSTELIQQSVFSMDSSSSVEPPSVSAKSREIYEEYVRRRTEGARALSTGTKNMYQQYVNTNRISCL